MTYWAYEYAYKDGRINVSSLINDLEIPTIGILNGPGFHTEIALMCDLTIAAKTRSSSICITTSARFPATVSTVAFRNCWA